MAKKVQAQKKSCNRHLFRRKKKQKKKEKKQEHIFIMTNNNFISNTEKKELTYAEQSSVLTSRYCATELARGQDMADRTPWHSTRETDYLNRQGNKAQVETMGN